MTALVIRFVLAKIFFDIEIMSNLLKNFEDSPQKQNKFLPKRRQYAMQMIRARIIVNLVNLSFQIVNGSYFLASNSSFYESRILSNDRKFKYTEFDDYYKTTFH